jgi:hypothetical protein
MKTAIESPAERNENRERTQLISSDQNAWVSSEQIGPRRTAYGTYDVNSAEPAILGKALLDLYRCPANFFNIQLTGQLSDQDGYFRLGDNTICFGRLSSGFTSPRADDELYHASDDIDLRNGCASMPFDPDEVIDNLRLERYLKHAGENTQNRWERAFKDAYYRFRPFLPVNVRKHIQRAYLKTRAHSVFPHWPVDTTVENLCEHLLLSSMKAAGIEEIPFIWFWPKGAQSAFTMTHDVETEDGRDFCHELINIDESFGIKASFQIVPEERYALSAGFIQSIRNRGFEVNVQDLNHDGNLFRDPEEFKRRAQKINKYAESFGASGFRAAVLYRNFDWYRELQFSYDMSVPNVAHFDPQPGGCCTVMPYFIDKILEVPVTTTQDYTLFHLMSDYSLDLWKRQIALILSRHGLATFIIHPDYVIEEKARRVYTDLLTLLGQLRQEHNLWFALPGEIDQWWRARQKMRIVNRDDKWCIEGDHAESAKLAFAHRVGDHLEYEISE